MRARALSVPRSEGETVRRALVDAGLLRTDLAIRHDHEQLLIPVIGGVEVPARFGEPTEADFETVGRSGPADYRDLIPGTLADREELPRSFDVVGDLVLVRVPSALASREPEIGQALLEFVPGARLVGADRGVHGVDRRRTIERLAGSGAWRTRHRENGIELEVDLERAYFSPRLAREHARVASEVRAGDRVYDLCCGVGPFTATIARDGRARAVTAVDANPDAIDLLRATLERLRATVPVDARVGDVGLFAPAAPPAERVILNLPHEGIKYLPSVARSVAPGGRLYYYEVTPRSEFERRGQTIVRSFEGSSEWRAADPHVVHPYSPSADLISIAFDRAPWSDRR
jgi:tRNA (guanine37-N1)-methyltransferase